MFRLWCLAEEDLLDAANAYESVIYNITAPSFVFFNGAHIMLQQIANHQCRYKLVDTGQGIHRQQQAPRILAAMVRYQGTLFYVFISDLVLLRACRLFFKLEFAYNHCESSRSHRLLYFTLDVDTFDILFIFALL